MHGSLWPSYFSAADVLPELPEAALQLFLNLKIPRLQNVMFGRQMQISKMQIS